MDTKFVVQLSKDDSVLVFSKVLSKFQQGNICSANVWKKMTMS